MKRTRYIAIGMIISLFLLSSAVYAASNPEATAARVTSTVIEGQASGSTETTTATTPAIPVPEDSTTIVTKQNAPGAGWIILVMTTFPLAIGFALGWFVCKKIQEKKAAAYAADDFEDQDEDTQYEEVEQPAPVVREQTRKHVEPKPMQVDRVYAQPVREPVITPRSYAPPVPVVPVAPPAPKIPDPIPWQIDDWGNPYFYDDQGIPYYYDPATHARTYYAENESET